MAVETKNTFSFSVPGLDLGATLFCGQSFGWREVQPGLYHGVAGLHAAAARMQNEQLVLTPLAGAATIPIPEQDVAFWRRYFALDTDYPALCRRFSQDPALARCVAAGCGIRVLRQPFWDTLLSFIISQNNHIPRITTITAALRQQFGPRIAPGLHAYPAPETLAALTLEQLSSIRAGFRAKYLLDAARRVSSGEVNEPLLDTLPNAEARALLMRIHGVGPKVADCVLLYGLGRTRVVPMDVWMKRAMAQLFPAGMPAAATGYEGIAQQFIFCHARAGGVSGQTPESK